MQLQLSLQETSCCRDHWLRFMTSGASYILTIPSAEQVANIRPICLGANFTSVTDVLLSTSVVLFTQWLCPRSLSFDSPTISSQTAAVRSKEQEAKTWPNSGWAHVTRHTDPLCVFQLAVQCQSPLSLLSQTLTLWSLEQVAIRRPWKSKDTSWMRSLWSAAMLRATNMAAAGSSRLPWAVKWRLSEWEIQLQRLQPLSPAAEAPPISGRGRPLRSSNPRASAPPPLLPCSLAQPTRSPPLARPFARRCPRPPLSRGQPPSARAQRATLRFPLPLPLPSPSLPSP